MKHTFIILTIALAISACGGEESTPPQDVIPPVPDMKQAPIVNPVILPNALRVASLLTIDLSNAIIDTNGSSELSSVVLRSDSSPSCDTSLKFEGKRITVTAKADVDSPVLCSYDYTAKSGQYSAQSILAFGVTQSGALTPTLSWLGGEGTIGESITVSITQTGSLGDAVTVLGDDNATVNVDSDAKTITFMGTSLGVTRVMYTLTNGKDVQIGVVDFTISEDINIAPTALRGAAVMAKSKSTTFDLAYFPGFNGAPTESLVQDYHSDGSNSGVQKLKIQTIIPALGIKAEIIQPLSINVTTTAPGSFPIYYLVTDGDGGYAYNLIEITVEGTSGNFMLRDAHYELKTSPFTRTLPINTTLFAQTSSGISQFELMAESVKITNKRPIGSSYNPTATQTANSTVINYTSTSQQKGMSNITYELKDKLTGIVVEGHILVNMDYGDDQLPFFSHIWKSGLHDNNDILKHGIKVERGAYCDGTTCDSNKTKWEWRQSGDTVMTSVGQYATYTVQYFPCGYESLELIATPVGTMIVNGITKDVEGLPVRQSWKSSTLPEIIFDQTTAKEDEKIKFQLHSCSTDTYRIVIDNGKDRKGKAQNDYPAKIRGIDGSLTSILDINIPKDTFKVFTLKVGDINGKPKGGLKNTIHISVNNNELLSKDIIFTTLTSPNVACANRYGHMENLLDPRESMSQYNNTTRPYLNCEVQSNYGSRVFPPSTDNNEEWKLLESGHIGEFLYLYCSDKFGKDARPVRDNELISITNRNNTSYKYPQGFSNIRPTIDNPQPYSWYVQNTIFRFPHGWCWYNNQDGAGSAQHCPGNNLSWVRQPRLFRPISFLHSETANEHADHWGSLTLCGFD